MSSCYLGGDKCESPVGFIVRGESEPPFSKFYICAKHAAECSTHSWWSNYRYHSTDPEAILAEWRRKHIG